MLVTEQQPSRTRCLGWTTNNSTNYMRWVSQRGNSKNLPDGLKKKPARWNVSSGGTVRREEQENELARISSLSLPLPSHPPSQNVYIFTPGMSHTMESIAKRAPAASPFRRQSHWRWTAKRGVVGCAHTSSRQPCGPDNEEKDSCLEALVEQQDWDELLSIPFPPLPSHQTFGQNRHDNSCTTEPSQTTTSKSHRHSPCLRQTPPAVELSPLRFWWNSILTGFRRSRAGTAQHCTLSKCRYSGHHIVELQ